MQGNGRFWILSASYVVGYTWLACLAAAVIVWLVGSDWLPFTACTQGALLLDLYFIRASSFRSGVWLYFRYPPGPFAPSKCTFFVSNL